MAPRPRANGSLLTFIGLGFWQAWWMIAMCSNMLPLHNTEGSGPLAFVMVATALGYLAVAFLPKKIMPLVGNIPCYGVCAFLATGGSLGLVAAGLLSGTSAYVVFVASVICFSLGNALLLAMWGEFWSTLAMGRVARCLMASYVFAFVLFFAVLSVPNALGAPLLAIMPTASLLVLYLSRNEPKREAAQTQFEMESKPSAFIFVPLVLLSIVWGTTQAIFPYLDTQGGGSIGASALAAGLLLAAVLVSTIVFPPSIEPVALYRIIVPSISCGLIMIVIAPELMANVGNGLVMVGIYALDMLVMLVSTDLAFRMRKPPVRYFALAVFATRIGTAVGTIAAHEMMVYLLTNGDWMHDTILTCAIIAIIVGSLVFTQSDLMKLYRTLPVHAATVSLDERCENIAQAFGLTNRESEVLRLLARGRSIPYIAKELVIANGTVKHHVSNLYRKIGVYDRQSLHDVIEQGAKQ
ncbi:hypothetical protein AAY81_01820 [Denitrobacterium detoxificans]|uniref:Regulatory protein, luxR family n=1 Tax=Denitrobacterium detoxificans TaxID=79604 RepID=A0A172RWL1_9ACTN|nr:LuxR C-terminal-related transcriptional regulator [Denitrobacterium detoxificans]ANE22097.1 hypothetical protein AAY81_01820 [Denitrobacterium detoxificans]SEO88940.1 regulatory protein, luxR family [Denitrobacterium detoxificans]